MPRLLAILLATALLSFSQNRVPQAIPPLSSVPVPVPAGLANYVQDNAALLLLGKALFWDMQVGSDGKVACASCHFHAGADHRIHNTLSNAVGSVQPNKTLAAADFPFHQLANPTNAGSMVLRDSSQVAGSIGMYNRSFTGIIPGLPVDSGMDAADPTFQVNGLNLRQVGARNAPSVINAVLNFRNFWDGRARNAFTGPTPFGDSDTRANVLSSAGGSLQKETLRLTNSSLASQAVGPVLSTPEMSYNIRNWALVGKKLLTLHPLAYQKIALDDSVLGNYASPTARGFQSATTYVDLVKAAFQQKYWDSTQEVDGTGAVLAADSTASERFSQAEFNFFLFFGLSVQAYESTLVSGDTPVDRSAAGDANALSASALRGLLLFTGSTGCNACHKGAETTLASIGGATSNDPLATGADTGFFRIGVRPIDEDLGLGGNDDFGKPLAEVLPVDDSPGSAKGRFKTPGLRNVEFTGPYFHNGGQETLEQVIQFYDRGGDFPPGPEAGPNVRVLNLTDTQQADLVAFLKALSDDRVRYERAPFDHPELCVADGSTAAQNGNPAFPMTAGDHWAGLPAVGKNGNTVPLQTFPELLAGTGADGSRAHNMADPCEIAAVTATGFVNSSAATYLPSIVAQDSIATAYGTAFTTTIMAADGPAPTTLGGLSVNITDAAGATHAAPLFYVSPTQINYVVPADTAAGGATVSVSGGTGAFQTPLEIAAVSPGLFGTDTHLAAANVVSYLDGVQTNGLTVGVDASGGLILNPIDLGPDGQQTYLILYGTGIRNHTTDVTATIGSQTVAAAYAGPQGTYPGEDQINVLLPRSLKGAGVVEVTLTVDGQTTNAVKVQIQ